MKKECFANAFKYITYYDMYNCIMNHDYIYVYILHYIHIHTLYICIYTTNICMYVRLEDVFKGLGSTFKSIGF